MTLDPSVFKAYDVRGIVPDELDADGAYRIVRAYVDEFEPRTMAIGRDMRLTSPELCEAAIQAALDAGSDVDEIGLVGTEMLYYAVCEHGYDGGLIVTASHNPKQYNGMKIVRRNALPLGGDGGIEKVRDRALAGTFRTPAAPGKRGQRDVLQGFAERCLAIVDVDAIAPLQVVLDGANGMAGTMMEPILERLPLRAERCHFDPDGTFPHYQPNPLLEENRAVHHRRGQADRRRSRHRLGRRRRSLLLHRRHRRVRAGRLHHRADRRVDAGQAPGRDDPLRPARLARGARHGRAHGRHRDREPRRPRLHQAPHAQGERALRGRGLGPLLLPRLLRRGHGHRSRRWSCWSSLSRSGKRISELLAPLHERYHLSGEINSTVADVPLKLQELKERYGPGGEGGRITHLDGVSVDFDDWHFNVRPSNTEPLLRLNLEAYSAAEMERRRDEVLALIRS